ncbi:MAG: RC-LH1 core complex protein PufX [Hasllibacter sp.]
MPDDRTASLDTPLGAAHPSTVLRQQGLGLMLRGAGYGALAFFGPIAVIYVIYLIGLLLPEESKLAPDPTPESSVPWLTQDRTFA